MSLARRNHLLAGASLALGILVLWLHPADQYLFGDSISTLLTRTLSWRAAFLDLFRLGGTHWYRPLTNGWVQAIVWPLFGLNFAPYHYLAMAMHWAVCLGIFLFLRGVVQDTFAAWAGAAFYAWHPIQFYATYDVCFFQEPIGIGFTFGAIAGFFWFVKRGHQGWLALGCACFAMALVSREVAVLTPALLAILLWRPENWRRAATTVGATAAVAAAFVYAYLFVLHPQLHQPAEYASDWSPANMGGNLWKAALWAFAIPLAL